MSCCFNDIPNNCEKTNCMSDSEEPTNQTEPGPLPGPSNVKIARASGQSMISFQLNVGENFMPTDISDNVEQILNDQANALYYNVCGLFINRTKSNDDFTGLFEQAHIFVTIEEHVSLSSRLKFSNKPHKLTMKLYFWLRNQNIKKVADIVLQSQEEQINNPKDAEGISDAAKSKLRYIAGA